MLHLYLDPPYILKFLQNFNLLGSIEVNDGIEFRLSSSNVFQNFFKITQFSVFGNEKIDGYNFDFIFLWQFCLWCCSKTNSREFMGMQFRGGITVLKILWTEYLNSFIDFSSSMVYWTFSIGTAATMILAPISIVLKHQIKKCWNIGKIFTNKIRFLSSIILNHPVQESRVCPIFRQTDLKWSLIDQESADIKKISKIGHLTGIQLDFVIVRYPFGDPLS